MSTTSIWGAVPDNVDLAENQKGEILGAVLTLMILSTLFIIVRLFTRIFQKGGGLSADDYLIVVGWVSSCSEDGQVGMTV
jgi:hypothetical protein